LHRISQVVTTKNKAQKNACIEEVELLDPLQSTIKLGNP
jgi:hypothetical protein